MTKIGIIGGGLAPYFNEAMANQIYILSKKLNIPVLTFNDIGYHLFKRMERYTIINSKFFTKKTPILWLINGLFIYIMTKIYERKFDLIIIPGGLESSFLKYLDPKKCVPIVTSLPEFESKKYEIQKLASKVKKIIVQSEKVKRQLVSIGISPEKIVVMYPLIDLSKFKYTKPPSLDEFRILFASAPNLEIPEIDAYREKGVHLLLESFAEFIKKYPNAKLYILWRNKYNKRLKKDIKKYKLDKNVVVINKVIKNREEMYYNTHITIIPFVSLKQSPELPLSALEALASGRPVVSTDVTEISQIIFKYKCGCVTKPSVDSMFTALSQCKANYVEYQKNTKLFLRYFLKNNYKEIKKLIYKL